MYFNEIPGHKLPLKSSGKAGSRIGNPSCCISWYEFFGWSYHWKGDAYISSPALTATTRQLLSKVHIINALQCKVCLCILYIYAYISYVYVCILLLWFLFWINFLIHWLKQDSVNIAPYMINYCTWCISYSGRFIDEWTNFMTSK